MGIDNITIKVLDLDHIILLWVIVTTSNRTTLNEVISKIS
jgi:hypothetical protein